MISVLILTRNEELDLPGAFASISALSGDQPPDIHVLDSYSTDATAAIAHAAGAHLTQRVFDNYANHRNFGFTLPFRYPWLFILDADERPTHELVAEMQRAVRAASSDTSGSPAAYRIRRRDFLFSTWLRHTQLTPFYIRLVRPQRARWTRSVNEVLEIDGPILDLRFPFDHYPFSKGIAHWVDKHNRYSTMEAAIIDTQSGLQNPSILTALRSPDFHTRRLHQKALYYKLPCRPLIKWLYLVILRGGLLDGPAGIAYATLAAFYEYLIVLKTRELRLRNRPSPLRDE